MAQMLEQGFIVAPPNISRFKRISMGLLSNSQFLDVVNLI